MWQTFGISKLIAPITHIAWWLRITLLHINLAEDGCTAISDMCPRRAWDARCGRQTHVISHWEPALSPLWLSGATVIISVNSCVHSIVEFVCVCIALFLHGVILIVILFLSNALSSPHYFFTKKQWQDHETYFNDSQFWVSENPFNVPCDLLRCLNNHAFFCFMTRHVRQSWKMGREAQHSKISSVAH